MILIFLLIPAIPSCLGSDPSKLGLHASGGAVHFKMENSFSRGSKTLYPYESISYWILVSLLGRTLLTFQVPRIQELFYFLLDNPILNMRIDCKYPWFSVILKLMHQLPHLDSANGHVIFHSSPSCPCTLSSTDYILNLFHQSFAYVNFGQLPWR